ncbi:ribosomal RNA small subunit methyltransferase F [Klebsiella pneumoniae]|uniref:Ribosomal RNA small subunit methyltransferase F n=1 Tax=Klebsiella pneumoniae TaxID=573 RepID=A0A2X3F1U1_KLEPN|nr:ribosomal RNA small subunit methyltransferase F [Klebsiella pneumoniae]
MYSTCTLNREENQSVIEWLLSRYPQAVEILPLGELFPGAADALTRKVFCTFFRKFTIAKASLSRVAQNCGDRSAPAPGYKVGKFRLRR